MQLDHSPALVPDKRSIIQIQEEERELQTEADFLKWWTAEEERVRDEEAQLAAFARGDGLKNKPPRKPKSAKKPPSTKQATIPNADVVGGPSDPSRQAGTQQTGQSHRRQSKYKANNGGRMQASAVGS